MKPTFTRILSCSVCKKQTQHLFFFSEKQDLREHLPLLRPLRLKTDFMTHFTCIEHHFNSEKIKALIAGIENLIEESPFEH